MILQPKYVYKCLVRVTCFTMSTITLKIDNAIQVKHVRAYVIPYTNKLI